MNEKLTLAHPAVEVKAADFRAAAGRTVKMKRGPAGSKNVIPADTILSPDANGIMVETPVMSSLVESKSPWRVRVSVDARRLVDVCERFKKIGAYKAADDTLWLSVQNGELRVKFRTTSVGIPIL